MYTCIMILVASNLYSLMNQKLFHGGNAYNFISIYIFQNLGHVIDTILNEAR